MRYIVARRPWPFDNTRPLKRPWGLYRTASPDVEGLRQDQAQASREDGLAIGFYPTLEEAQAASPEPAEVRR